MAYTPPNTLSALRYDEFVEWLAPQPSVEMLPSTNEWEVVRYRRATAAGTHEYSIIYRNKKNKLTFTGESAADYERFEREIKE